MNLAIVNSLVHGGGCHGGVVSSLTTQDELIIPSLTVQFGSCVDIGRICC
jgi:hypothetical protein